MYKAQERSGELSKVADLREFDLRRTTEAYDGAHADLLRARDDQARLQDEQGQLSRALDLKMGEKADLARRSDNENDRNKALQSNLYDLESKCRHTDEQLGASRREQDDLRYANSKLGENNGDMQAEIDALENHCNVLTG